MTMPPPRIKGFVFFALNHDTGLVRVGYSTEPKAQLRKFRTANPGRVDMTLVIPGTEQTYRAMAAKLAGCHVNNGWYDAVKCASILFGVGGFP